MVSVNTHQTETAAVSRVPLVADDQADDVLAATFERCRAEQGIVANLYRALASSPQMLDAWIDFAWALRAQPSVARSLRELAILRVSELTGSAYEHRIHGYLARKSGISREQLEGLDQWRGSELYDAQQRAVLAMTDELTLDGVLTDESWQTLSEQFGTQDCIDLILTSSFYSCVSRVIAALRIPLESDERPPSGPATATSIQTQSSERSASDA